MPKKIVKGFTLIELLVIVAIIGILSTIGVVAYSKYTKIAQISAIKAQNKEMHDFIKTTILTTCINYSDSVSLKYGSQNKTWTASCNKSSDWHTVGSMYFPFKLYFAGKSDFRNVIQGQTVAGSSTKNPYAMGGSCPNRASADQSMKPGNHCISYESMGSRSFSQNACSSKGYGTWIIVGSMLPDKDYYFSCVGKTW
ncbi:prepilin-type N-terminal cleavage/methylation domain-containing protein [Candidatus Pelagibacter sp.]|nr:prepilin-type N-terminal cleavage/methylation domain-containing protein [Candidatus Pelagibacter sp.]